MAGQFFHNLIPLMQLINGHDHYLIKLLLDSNLSSRRWVTYTYSHAHNKRNITLRRNSIPTYIFQMFNKGNKKLVLLNSSKRTPCNFIYGRFSKQINTTLLARMRT
jgi:hypothetical protein